MKQFRLKVFYKNELYPQNLSIDIFQNFLAVPSREVEKQEGKFWTHWNKDTKQFFLQFAFKLDPKMPRGPPRGMYNMPGFQ